MLARQISLVYNRLVPTIYLRVKKWATVYDNKISSSDLNCIKV